MTKKQRLGRCFLVSLSWVAVCLAQVGTMGCARTSDEPLSQGDQTPSRSSSDSMIDEKTDPTDLTESSETESPDEPEEMDCEEVDVERYCASSACPSGPVAHGEACGAGFDPRLGGTYYSWRYDKGCGYRRSSIAHDDVGTHTIRVTSESTGGLVYFYSVTFGPGEDGAFTKIVTEVGCEPECDSWTIDTCEEPMTGLGGSPTP